MIFGGILDRCYSSNDSLTTALSRLVISGKYGYDIMSYNITSPMTRFCFTSECEHREMDVSVYPGQRFNVPVLCADQLAQPLKCTVISEYNSTDIEFGQGENKREITGSNNLTFHASSERNGITTLTIESNTACTDSKWSTLVVFVKLEPCPLGFQLTNRQCHCDNRLRDSFTNLKCNINDISITLQYSWWFDYQGGYLRTHRNCPLNYCYKSGTKMFLLKCPQNLNVRIIAKVFSVASVRLTTVF